MPDYLDDTRSTSELLLIALAFRDSDEAWEAITTLRARATPEMLGLAKDLVRSSEPARRRMGANILAQLGWPDFALKGEYAFQDEALELLRPLLHDEDDEVVASAAIALGHREDEASIPTLLALKDHPNPDVRFAVAVATSTQTTDEVIEATVDLSRDIDATVRNWATFSLGSLIQADSSAIRSALADRLTDEELDVVFEAVVGLGSREDASAALGLQKLLGSKALTELPEWIAHYLDERAATTLLRNYNQLVTSSAA